MEGVGETHLLEDVVEQSVVGVVIHVGRRMDTRGSAASEGRWRDSAYRELPYIGLVIGRWMVAEDGLYQRSQSGTVPRRFDTLPRARHHGVDI